MVGVGILFATGGQVLRSRSRHAPGANPVPAVDVTQSAPEARVTAPASDSTPSPAAVAENFRPAVTRAGGKLANGSARPRPGGPPPATARAASFERYERLHHLNAEQVRATTFAAGGARAAVVADDRLDLYEMAPRGGKESVALEQLAPGLGDPAQAPTAVALSPDGRQAYLAAALPAATASNGRAKGTAVNAVVHWEYGQSPTLLYGPAVESMGRPEYLSVALAPDGGVVAAGSMKSRCASWWDAARPPRRREFPHLVGDTVAGLALSPDGKRILVCGRDGGLCLHTLGPSGAVAPVPYKGLGGAARCAAFSADGRHALTGGRDGKVCVWDLGDPPPADGILRLKREFSWHAGEVRSVAFARSDDRFLSGGDDGVVCQGELDRSGEPLRWRPDLPAAPVLAVAFSGDGAYALDATDRSLGRYLLRPPHLAESRPDGRSAAVAKPFAAR
jgi:hypothetical protein